MAQVRYPPKSAFLINFERFGIDCWRQLYVIVGFVLRLPSALICSIIVLKMVWETQCFLFQPIKTKA